MIESRKSKVETGLHPAISAHVLQDMLKVLKTLYCCFEEIVQEVFPRKKEIGKMECVKNNDIGFDNDALTLGKDCLCARGSAKR